MKLRITKTTVQLTSRRRVLNFAKYQECDMFVTYCNYINCE